VVLLDPTVALPEEWDSNRVSDADRVGDIRPPEGAPRSILRGIHLERADLESSYPGADPDGYAADLGSVDLQEGVLLGDLLGRHVRNCFAASGIELIDGREGRGDGGVVESSRYALVEVELRELYVVHIPKGPGLAGETMSHSMATVSFEVVIQDPNGETELYRRVCRGKELRSWSADPAWSSEALRSIHEETLNRAYHEAMSQLMDDLRDTVTRLLVGDESSEVRPAR
jgi:hypothetical protein